MVNFTYTDRRDAIQQIEALLGDEGSTSIAKSILNDATYDGLAARNDEGVLEFRATQAQWYAYIDGALLDQEPTKED